jgi:peptidoglycan/LPS O-acetylase OafA/YrhL
LRAIAVVAVVAFHLGVPFCSAGFLGVDVFFVLSGFLIVRLLLVERATTGRIALASFWSRRVRRLLPAVSAVVVASLGAALIVFPLQLDSIAHNGAAAALYAENVYSFTNSSGYWQDHTADLFIHTWSLSVEEQFYLVVPIVLVVVARGKRWLDVAALALVVLFVASLGECISYSAKSESATFLLAPFRAWEFAAGALVAVLEVRGVFAKRVSSKLPETAAAIGLALIALACAFSTRVAEVFPWPGAVGAVLGVVLVVAAGCASLDTLPARLLSLRPFAVVGALSYSIYLVHWPLLLFADAWFAPSRLAHLGVATLTLPVAAILHYTIERPIRFHRALSSSSPRTLLFGAALMASSCACAYGVQVASKSTSIGDRPALHRLDIESHDLTNTEPRCSATSLQQLHALCTWGDANSNGVVLLTGDSHAMEFLPAFRDAAARAHVKIVLAARQACPAFAVPMREPHSRVPYQRCDQWQQFIPTLIRQLHPKLVVAAQAQEAIEDRVYARDDVEARAKWDRALIAFDQIVHDSGASFAFFFDMPRLPRPPADCVARFGAAACGSDDADVARLRTFEAHERSVLGDDVTFFDPKDVLCPSGTCPAADSHGLAYADAGHLRRATAGRLGRAVEALIPK